MPQWFRWSVLLLAGFVGPVGADAIGAGAEPSGVELACGDRASAAEAAAASRVALAPPTLFWRRSRFGIQGRGSWVRFVPSAVA